MRGRVRSPAHESARKSRRMPTVQQLRVAVIGAGYIGQLHMAQAGNCPGVELVGFAESDPRRRKPAAARFGVPAFSYAGHMLQEIPVDAAIICVPPHARDGLEVSIAQQGIPLLVEKPIAVTLATGEQVAEALSQLSTLVVYGYQWRQLSCLPEIKARLAGRFVHLAIGHWLSSTPSANWWGKATTAGSTFIEQATHLIDLALLLLGPMTTVTASNSSSRISADADSFACAISASITFATGCVGSFVTCCTSPDSYRRSLELLSDEMAVSVTEDGCTIA